MNFKGIYYSLTFRLALAIGLTAALTYLALAEEWGWFLFLGVGWLADLAGHQPFVQAERAKGSLHVRRDRQ